MDQGEGSPVYTNLDDFNFECGDIIEDPKDSEYVPDSCSSSDEYEYFDFVPVGILHQKKKSSNLKESTSIPDLNPTCFVNSENNANISIQDANSTIIPNSEESATQHFSTKPANSKKTNNTLIPDLNPTCFVNSEDNANISIEDANSTIIIPNSEESATQHVSTEPEHFKKTKMDKKHVCVFCGKSLAKLERHLRIAHGEEREMIKFLSSSGKDKKAELAKLRNAGDHLHNIKILKEGEKNIVVKRALKRPHIEPDDFVPCPQCLGYFLKRDLWRHKCPAADCNASASLPKKQMVTAGRLLLPCKFKEDDEGLREIFATLRSDKISMIVKNDDLIKMLARRGFQRNGFDKDRHAHIRNQVREMGRLLTELRRKTNQENAQLKDFIRPQHFRSVVEATKAVAGYTCDGQVYKTPALAMKLGHSLVKSCSLLKAEAIERQNSQVKADCDAFHELYTIQWNAEISSSAHRTMYEGKKNNAAGLPLLEDISKLSRHLSSEGRHLRECLVSDDTTNIKKQKWLKLSEITLTSLMLFNRKRQGEISKMTVKDYIDGVSHQSHSDDVLSGLSDFEKSLCRKLTRVEITGERGRTVPIILTVEVKSSTDLILSLRKDAGVHPGNRYFFARNNNNSDGHLRGSDCIRKCTEEVSLKSPHLLRSTQLRKQIATLTQVLNLTENELDVVAQYMGHDIRVHREHYRLPSSTMQVAKVAKILLALDKGELPEDVNDDNSKKDSSESEDDDTPPTTAFQITETQTGAEINVGNSHAMSGSMRTNSALRDMSRRKKWSDGELAAIMRAFRRQISLASLPGKAEIQKAQKEEPALNNRTWIQIKNVVRNYLKKMK